MTDKKLELTDSYHFITRGTANGVRLNPLEWLHLVKLSLEGCKPIFRQVAENSGKALTFESIMNHPLEGGWHDEKRVTPKEVIDGLPKTLLINDNWLFLSVKTLETKEEKGQFFERRLFILADFALMLIVDMAYRKEPHPNPDHRMKHAPPRINENVVGCQVLASAELLGLEKGGFEEVIMPYFKDPKLGLGEYIVNRFLDNAIDELRKERCRVAELEVAMKPFLEIRTRMGIWNHLP